MARFSDALASGIGRLSTYGAKRLFISRLLKIFRGEYLAPAREPIIIRAHTYLDQAMIG
jgi:hypothetical protein